MLTMNRQLVLLPLTTITTAVAAGLSTAVTGLAGATSLSVQAMLTYGSGGTSIDVYLQTSLDGGTTFFDIAEWSFTTASATRIHSVRAQTVVAANYTPTDGSLSANTIKDGLIGDQFRIKYVTVGTYAGGTTLLVTGVCKGVR